MKLYFASGTRAERTAWLLNELELDYDMEVYKLRQSDAVAEFLAVNPNGRVPVLDDGDIRISESAAIAQYLLARYGNGRPEPAVDSPEYPVYPQWLHFAEGMMMGPIGNYVVEKILLPPERSLKHAKRAVKLVGNLLKSVDAHLEGETIWLENSARRIR